MPPQQNQTATSIPPMTKSGEKKVGPIVATLIIVLVLIIAALYLFASKINQPAIPTDAAMNDTSDQTASVQAITNTSTDVQDLQNDLNAADVGLDAQNF